MNANEVPQETGSASQWALVEAAEEEMEEWREPAAPQRMES
jgi:hypothetical protein